MTFESLLVPLIFIIGSTCFTAASKAMNSLGKIQLKKEFRSQPKLFYFYYFTRKLFPKDGWTNLTFLNDSTKQITRIIYATTFIFYLLSYGFFSTAFEKIEGHYTLNPSIFTLIVAIIVFIGLICDFFGNLYGVYHPKAALKTTYPIASLFLILFCPITFLLLKIQKSILENSKYSKSSYKVKEKILELVLESELQNELDLQDKKLIVSVASFRDRIAREIMVPRIDVHSLPSSATLKKASESFSKEGYSRIPIYKGSVDNIIGVLNYKDLLNYIMENKQEVLTENTIEGLLKPIVYAPETKKISHLLQEFRSKQIHIAIVVDEYGGTEGILTIEDILEELVGEIADEYDNLQDELLFKSHPQGGWIVDAKMNIIDIEKELNILIPQSPEYDTLGGYVFHRAGAIPTRGWRIHHENFDLEIIKSSERSVEKIRIIPAEKQEL
ncbi:hypothetical protein COB11_05470 [Candidatus Aerophobetes bacterium]|uniref:CBS domain-containing protein n=1 Tax=Aerophobetes bacterium TaxID=2030807 RepID=A0A2A4YG92_UNCAE|nr:MAG: hypothetical protein COB11_05470 [Candidatus Aerophobetes bacterium]